MSPRPFSTTNFVKSLCVSMKYPMAFFIAIASYQAYATPSNMGAFTTTKQGFVDGKWQAEGRYTAASTTSGSSSWGAFKIIREEMTGYDNNVSLRPANGSTGFNGVEIKNEDNTSIAQDKLKYTFIITPDENTSVHTIKIGQASYTTNGNSEVARQTLEYSKNPNISIPAQATIRNNPDIPYFYDAMGDYFMGAREGNTNNFTYNNPINAPQLRFNSGTNLYFYRLDFLNGTNLGNDRFRPNTNNNQVSVRNNANGFLPPSPTFNNIIKSTSTNPNNQNTYPALTTGTSISNGGQYISYGIENSASKYVVAVKNANSVTLTYEGIMNGNNAFKGEKVGETFNEWISFGVESELVNYEFSGKVYNDNGGIDDQYAANHPDTIGGIYNNGQYFNGTLDSNESGITGSTVSLASNCNSTAPSIIASQTVTAANGEYNFTVPISTINSSNSICIIEDNNSNYPIRTTSARRPVTLSSNQYLYEDINFGRVIAANKALVLEKEQAINDCTITTLLPSSQNNLNYSKSPLTEIKSSQCIAYRLTATNRANLPISDFIMRDKLQKAGVDNALITSILVNPVYNSGDYNYNAGSVTVNNNGTVITNPLSIALRSQRVFYFNTKYGDNQPSP